MKKMLAAVVGLVVAVGVVIAGNYGVDVGGTSVRIVPQRFANADKTLTTTTVYAVQGEYISFSNTIFMVLTPGTSGASNPDLNSGYQVDGSVGLVRVIRGERKGVVVCNSGTGIVFIASATSAVVSAGTQLAGGNGIVLDYGVFNDEESAVSVVGTNRVTVMEW